MVVETLEPLIPIFIEVVKGFGAGAMYATFGYLKSGEAFEGEKFTKTIIIGGVVGSLRGGLDVPIEKAEEYITYPLVILVIDYTAKALWRRVLKPLIDKLK